MKHTILLLFFGAVVTNLVLSQTPTKEEVFQSLERYEISTLKSYLRSGGDIHIRDLAGKNLVDYIALYWNLPALFELREANYRFNRNDRVLIKDGIKSNRPLQMVCDSGKSSQYQSQSVISIRYCFEDLYTIKKHGNSSYIQIPGDLEYYGSYVPKLWPVKYHIIKNALKRVRFDLLLFGMTMSGFDEKRSPGGNIGFGIIVPLYNTYSSREFIRYTPDIYTYDVTYQNILGNIPKIRNGSITNIIIGDRDYMIASPSNLDQHQNINHFGVNLQFQVYYSHIGSDAPSGDGPFFDAAGRYDYDCEYDFINFDPTVMVEYYVTPFTKTVTLYLKGGLDFKYNIGGKLWWDPFAQPTIYDISEYIDPFHLFLQFGFGFNAGSFYMELNNMIPTDNIIIDTESKLRGGTLNIGFRF